MHAVRQRQVQVLRRRQLRVHRLPQGQVQYLVPQILPTLPREEHHGGQQRNFVQRLHVPDRLVMVTNADVNVCTPSKSALELTCPEGKYLEIAELRAKLE